jgi:hypothetical protein
MTPNPAQERVNIFDGLTIPSDRGIVDDSVTQPGLARDLHVKRIIDILPELDEKPEVSLLAKGKIIS